MADVTMEHTPITLGYWYRDMVSGFTGVAVAYDTDIDGCAHVHLQKRLGEVAEKDGKFDVGVLFLANRLEPIAGEGFEPLPMTREIQADTPIKLGRKYQDRVTEFVGTATSRTEALEGYIHVTLDPGVDKKGKMQPRFSFDESRLIDIETEEQVISAAPSGCDRREVAR